MRELRLQDVGELGGEVEAARRDRLHRRHEGLGRGQLGDVSGGARADRAEHVPGPPRHRHHQHPRPGAEPGHRVETGLVPVVVEVEHDQVEVGRVAGAERVEQAGGRGGGGHDPDRPGLGEYLLDPPPGDRMVVDDGDPDHVGPP